MSFGLTDTASETATDSGTGRDSGSNREKLKLMTLEYTNVSEGNFVDEPVVELFCRDLSGERRLITVEDYTPHFYVTEEELLDNKDTLLTDSRVRNLTIRDSQLDEADRLNNSITGVETAPRRTLNEQPLARIDTVVPGDVAEIRDLFDDHWEADVFFTNRFLIDSGVTLGLSVPAGESTVSFDEIEVLPDGEEPDVRPRMCSVDIEVWAGSGFPDTQNPRKPVTAITAHDSYEDRYFVGVLHPDGTDRGTDHSWPESVDWELPDGVSSEQVSIIVYDREVDLLEAFNEFVVETDPDLLTGWNSSRNDIGSGFDYPYLINRCERLNVLSYHDLSYENGATFVTNRGSPNIAGREMFDMLQAYKKTQIHEKRSYSLGYIANEELDYGKEDIEDLDEGWLHDPAQFIKYNIRDTQAVHEIEEAKSVLDMYDHIRSIAGATYSEIADSNIGIIDVLFLRSAKEQGYALPTSERPDVQHYWGAYVFEPQAGKHRNVVYPDLSSLYPNLFRDMNASPETIIGDADDLERSEYSAEDCHTIYVDPRDETVKKAADEPERKELYVLKPEIKESFVRDIVGELIDMKYEYKSDQYSDEAYAAVKRITNSVYGVMGDSVSYGKGFRLFDWRIAEAITLAGRDVIKHTASTFEDRVRSMGYADAEIIAGDTDSCVCTLPGADGSYTRSSFSKEEVRARIEDSDLLSIDGAAADSEIHETLLAALDAAEYVDMTYDQFMEDRFGIEDGNMAVEIESYADSALFMDAKKRYAQWIRWDEGEYVDEVEYKGFELVRSDSAQITAEVQKGVLSRILKEDDAKGSVGDYLKEWWDRATSGEIDLELIGTPSAVNNPLMDYGWSEDDETGELKYYTPQPHIRGARYATAYIDGEELSEGSKPLMFYVNGVRPTGDLPETYDYEDEFSLNAPHDKPDRNTREMKELGRRVDAVSVEETRNITADIRIDYEKMAEKTIRDPVEPIVNVLEWDFDDLVADGEQSGLAAYM